MEFTHHESAKGEVDFLGCDILINGWPRGDEQSNHRKWLGYMVNRAILCVTGGGGAAADLHQQTLQLKVFTT